MFDTDQVWIDQSNTLKWYFRTEQKKKTEFCALDT